ncbi:hypothetical protein [Streptomyces sp. NPDC005181]|uniref:hypothetical protein n=1 Tax=Streptomyces sp. NPDC005181 TaxID=3156869 RepID=UPI0033B9B72E
MHAALTVAGLGTGLFTPPFFTTALRGVGPQETGSAAGLLNAVQQLGGTFGVAMVGGVYLAGDGTPRGAAQAALATAGAILAATGIAAAAMTGRRGRGTGAGCETDRRDGIAAPDDPAGSLGSAGLDQGAAETSHH